ncbi:MAG: sulfite dehydrogenase [Gemmatimonadetes bacterium]|nr:sulfite dehydrogenase [Gemmatimonadota bacterium]
MSASRHDPAPDRGRLSRRAMVGGTAAAAGALIFATLPDAAGGQGGPAAAAPPPPPPPVPADPTKVLGAPTSAVSARSQFVVTGRNPVGAVSGSSLTPLHQFSGNITPADLQFERHHAGVPTIDPATWQLMVHGLVDREMIFTLDDLMSLPSETRVHFLECSGNGRLGFKGVRPDLSPQNIDGLLCNAEWTGVPVKTLLAEVGVKSGAEWALAEGGDAALMSRSVPMAKLMDDAMLVYAQNGEPLRPAGGYPVRLFLPGWEGNTNVKWIRRLELLSEPNMSKDETSKYTDPLPNNTARIFSFDLDAKSTITYPTFPNTVKKPGWVQVSGLAWSGRGRITAVDVSVDGGATWVEAKLAGTPQPKAAIRFTHMWKWDGSPATLMSRAVDETGYVQPTFAVFKAGRGPGTDYHYNHIRAWKVAADGVVTYAGEV